MQVEKVRTAGRFRYPAIFKDVINLPEGENFILILDDKTVSLINCVCGQFALFDRGCIRITWFWVSDR